MTARRRELAQALALSGRESSAATVMLHTAIAERAGLTASDTKTMDILVRSGPLTAGEIALRTGLATASVTTLIDRLESKGLVRRVPDPRDRRRVIVEPVAARVSEAEPFFRWMEGAFEGLLDFYSDDQLATILDFMRRSAERAREVTAQISTREEKVGAAMPEHGRRSNPKPARPRGARR
jgi:DNA-binding MarR family transcriptional regulator